MELKKLFREMIPVILGVLIALLINNLNEQRKDRQYVNKMMQAITTEIKENKKELDELAIKRWQMLDTIGHYIDEEISIGNVITKVNGLGGVSIRNTAWRSMMNSRMDLMDYKKISVLTDIGDQKELMIIQLKKMIDLVYERGASEDFKDMERFQLMLESIMYTEQELLRLHNEFLGVKNE